jgi:hypothetical protein
MQAKRSVHLGEGARLVLCLIGDAGVRTDGHSGEREKSEHHNSSMENLKGRLCRDVQRFGATAGSSDRLV